MYVHMYMTHVLFCDPYYMYTPSDQAEYIYGTMYMMTRLNNNNEPLILHIHNVDR